MSRQFAVVVAMFSATCAGRSDIFEAAMSLLGRTNENWAADWKRHVCEKGTPQVFGISYPTLTGVELQQTHAPRRTIKLVGVASPAHDCLELKSRLNGLRLLICR